MNCRCANQIQIRQGFARFDWQAQTNMRSLLERFCTKQIENGPRESGENEILLSKLQPID
jgi:hypothetical protein